MWIYSRTIYAEVPGHFIGVRVLVVFLDDESKVFKFKFRFESYFFLSDTNIAIITILQSKSI